jgi:hypothetical protein
LLPAIANATYLDVRGNNLVGADLAPLFKSTSKLTVLKAGGNDLGNAVAEIIAKWPGAKRLVRLDLTTGEKGARAIAKSPHFAKLLTLNMFGATLSPKTEIALLDSPHLASARIMVGLGRTLARKAREAELAKAKAKKPAAKKAAAKKKPSRKV